MLILPKHLQFPVKNPLWNTFTPNEHYVRNKTYRDYVDRFVQINDVGCTVNFMEVRIVRSKISLGPSTNWWDDSLFMEKVFWVFHKPLTIYPEGKAPWQAYFLEPMECVRVADIALEKFKRPVFDPTNAVMIPCECTHMAWDETSGGYSDHLRHREEVVPTQEEIDLQEQRTKEIRRMQEDFIPLEKTGVWNEEDTKTVLGSSKAGAAPRIVVPRGSSLSDTATTSKPTDSPVILKST